MKTITAAIAALSAGVLIAGCESFDMSNPVACCRAKAAKRIAQIRATPNMSVPESAKKFYVSELRGDDAADGLTPLTAWKTIARLNKESPAAGSFVLFERGGLYRGSVSTKPGVTYTAYGVGPKPRIYGSPVNGADPAKWTRTDNPKVWSFDIGHDDVGVIVFDNGAAHAIKVVYRTDKKTGAKFSMVTKRPFNSYRDLDTDLHFWHDYYKAGTGKVYLYSEQNPGERFKSIEFNVRTCGFRIGGPGVTIDNFYIAHVGVHGVSSGTTQHLHVRNCEFAWIGGSIQAEGIFGRDHPTRLGNGVEIYGGCEDYSVENCCFDQIYDAGVTHQLGIPAGGKLYNQKDVLYKDNVFLRCNYSIEYFLSREAPNNPSQMENIMIADNIMIDAGYGFCEQRPDHGCAAHIKSWGGHKDNRAKNITVRNNIMCLGGDMLVELCGELPNSDGVVNRPLWENNIIVGKDGQRFGDIAPTNKNKRYTAETEAFVNSFGTGNKCIVLTK